MNANIELALPWEEIREWHNEISDASREAYQKCMSSFKSENPTETLLALLSDENTCALFGTPESKPWILPTGVDDASVAERQRWGRRVQCYLNAFLDGLEVQQRVLPERTADDILRTLREVTHSFGIHFPTTIAPIRNLDLTAFPERPLEFASDFFVSFIDSVLFSCLIYLQQLEEYQPEKKPMHVQDALLGRIRSELERIFPSDNPEVKTQIQFGGDAEPFADEGTVWWAIRELLRLQGENFVVGKYQGYPGAAKLCRRLLGEDARALISPDKQLKRWLEATPEIYSPLRTRMFVLYHCANISKEMPNDVDEGLSDLLSHVACSHFREIQKAKPSFVHIYQLGVALKVSSQLIEYGPQEAPPDTSGPSPETISASSNSNGDRIAGAFLLPNLTLVVDGEFYNINETQHTLLAKIPRDKSIRGPKLNADSTCDHYSRVIKKLLKKIPDLSKYVAITHEPTNKRTKVYRSSIVDLTTLSFCLGCSKILPIVRTVNSESNDSWECKECGTVTVGRHKDEAVSCNLVGSVEQTETTRC